MKLSFKHLLFISISFFFYSVSLAQLSDTSKVISLSAQELYFNRSDNEEKMSSDLFYKVVHFLKETYKGQSVQKVITELKKDEFSTSTAVTNQFRDTDSTTNTQSPYRNS